MGAIWELQGMVSLALGVAAFGMEVFAFIDALRRPAEAFPYADKRTRNFWLIVTGVAALVGFVALRSVFGIGLLAVVAGAVYLVDVRPAVSQYRPRGRSSSGPYGSW